MTVFKMTLDIDRASFSGLVRSSHVLAFSILIFCASCTRKNEKSLAKTIGDKDIVTLVTKDGSLWFPGGEWGNDRVPLLSRVSQNPIERKKAQAQFQDKGFLVLDARDIFGNKSGPVVKQGDLTDVKDPDLHSLRSSALVAESFLKSLSGFGDLLKRSEAIANKYRTSQLTLDDSVRTLFDSHAPTLVTNALQVLPVQKQNPLLGTYTLSDWSREDLGRSYKAVSSWHKDFLRDDDFLVRGFLTMDSWNEQGQRLEFPNGTEIKSQNGGHDLNIGDRVLVLFTTVLGEQKLGYPATLHRGAFYTGEHRTIVSINIYPGDQLLDKLAKGDR